MIGRSFASFLKNALIARVIEGPLLPPIADLQGAKITLEQIRSAIIDENTNLPDGMNRDELLAEQKAADVESE